VLDYICASLGRAVLFLLLLCAALFGIVNVAFGQTLTRSHACPAFEDAKALSTHLIEKQWVGYAELAESMIAEGKCYNVLVPVPAPTPPVYRQESEAFSVGLFLVETQIGPAYTLLLRRFPEAGRT
jgi:hypothetical protein